MSASVYGWYHMGDREIRYFSHMFGSARVDIFQQTLKALDTHLIHICSNTDNTARISSTDPPVQAQCSYPNEQHNHAHRRVRTHRALPRSFPETRPRIPGIPRRAVLGAPMGSREGGDVPPAALVSGAKARTVQRRHRG
jgi:hypothetical protein